VPSLPWYQQLLLHRHVKKILTPRQREQFLITPVIGFPRLWWRIIRENWNVSSRFSARRGIAEGRRECERLTD
jgi:hypothetical protein